MDQLVSEIKNLQESEQKWHRQFPTAQLDELGSELDRRSRGYAEDEALAGRRRHSPTMPASSAGRGGCRRGGARRDARSSAGQGGSQRGGATRLREEKGAWPGGGAAFPALARGAGEARRRATAPTRPRPTLPHMQPGLARREAAGTRWKEAGGQSHIRDQHQRRSARASNGKIRRPTRPDPRS